MAISERSGANALEDLDTRFFDVMRKFRELAEASGGRYEIEYTNEHAPVAIRCDAERYPLQS